MTLKSQAEAYLKKALGRPDASFREGQWECIAELLSGKRVLVVQRTGWGKSMVYFLAARLLRDRGAGPCLLVSPLLSLMRNQIEAARRIGVRAATINSGNKEEWEAVRRAFSGGEIDILLISPERLANEDFYGNVLQHSAQGIGLLAVDEAHCISDWGHDFRPDYRRIAGVIQLLPRNVPVLAATATANNRVVNDIREQMGRDILIQRGSLVRSSLRLQNIPMPRADARLAWLAQVIPTLKGSGIVYVLTIRDAEQVSRWLKSNGISAMAYHSGLKEGREELEDALLQNRVKVLVATVALGMGFDKPDLGFVIHYQRPASVVHYYQQVGRAGRALENAYGILLCGEEDDEITEYFIRNAFPPQRHIADVLTALEHAEDGLTMAEIEAAVNLKRSTLANALKFLSLETPSPVYKDKSKYYASPAVYSYTLDTRRMEEISAIRRAEQEQMRRYMAHKGCLMSFLQQALDDPAQAPCGKCMNCAPSAALRQDVDPAFLAKASFFLKKYHLPIEPRKQWPRDGMFSSYAFPPGRTIPQGLRAEEGRALCLWGDPCWGKMIADGKYRENMFSDELVSACAEMLREWNPSPAPQWVACIPSLNRPFLVPDFAGRFAGMLGLPFVPCIEKIQQNQQQKSMENSFMQAKNLDGVFRINQPVRGVCLLVDDMVDSRWTFTVAAALLRQAGCSAVIPFALAITTGTNE